MKKIYLDARDLEHPIPLERAIDALKSLDEKSYFYMLHRKEPIPLLALASEHNLNFISINKQKEWHILISPNREIDLKEFLEA